MVKSSSRPDSSAARSATSNACSGVAHTRCGPRSSLRPVLRPRLRGRIAGLYGISGGLAAAASPSIVHSTARASRATRRETPVRAGMEFSHRVMSSVVSEPSSLAPKDGRMNRRIRYSRFSTVLSPTSCRVIHRSIHALTVIFPAFGSVQRPSRILASWSRPQVSAAALVSKPDSLVSMPLGSLYFTRHGFALLPRFSAYAMLSSG